MNRNDDPAVDRDFDARLRATWRTAVDAVPPVLARSLRPAQSRFRAGRAPARWALGAAVAAAAVFALAIGLRPHAVGAPGAMPPATDSIASTGDIGLTAPLDRSPDFYAWLASPDAEQLAME